MIDFFENHGTPTTPRLLSGSRLKTNGEVTKLAKQVMNVRMNDMKLIPITSDVQRSASNQGNQVHQDLHPFYVKKQVQTSPSNQGYCYFLHARKKKEKRGMFL